MCFLSIFGAVVVHLCRQTQFAALFLSPEEFSLSSFLIAKSIRPGSCLGKILHAFVVIYNMPNFACPIKKVKLHDYDINIDKEMSAGGRLCNTVNCHANKPSGPIMSKTFGI